MQVFYVQYKASCVFVCTCVFTDRYMYTASVSQKVGGRNR